MPLCIRPESGRVFEFRRSQGLDLFRKFSGNFGKTRAFGRRNPFQAQPFKVNAENISQLACHGKHPFSLYITIQVMTVADVSPGYQYAVSTLLKRLEYEIGINPA